MIQALAPVLRREGEPTGRASKQSRKPSHAWRLSADTEHTSKATNE